MFQLLEDLPIMCNEAVLEVQHAQRKQKEQYNRNACLLPELSIGDKCNLDNELPPKKLEVEIVYNLVGVWLLLGNAICKWHREQQS
ncbi:1631_t:CDS:2 [Cetraspora pellucida]|uniref:1631_t:CDS:1 n=1 Tax=Cetraspora pellucida TaxID=1433469 RepID=A0A9N9BV74_9GLOM|nr:1631_t:CDS:2 [Cetraspora pellucida]